MSGKLAKPWHRSHPFTREECVKGGRIAGRAAADKGGREYYSRLGKMGSREKKSEAGKKGGRARADKYYPHTIKKKPKPKVFWCKGYTRADGKVVAGHWRAAADRISYHRKTIEHLTKKSGA